MFNKHVALLTIVAASLAGANALTLSTDRPTTATTGLNTSLAETKKRDPKVCKYKAEKGYCSHQNEKTRRWVLRYCKKTCADLKAKELAAAKAAALKAEKLAAAARKAAALKAEKLAAAARKAAALKAKQLAAALKAKELAAALKAKELAAAAKAKELAAALKAKELAAAAKAKDLAALH
jgi:hypothetical protein